MAKNPAARAATVSFFDLIKGYFLSANLQAIEYKINHQSPLL